MIETITKSIQYTESQISTNKDIIIFYKEKLSEFYNERDKISAKIASLTSDVEYSQITTFHLNLKLRIKEMEKKYKNYQKTCTKDEYILLLNTLTQINSIISDIYGFNNKSIKNCVNLIKNDINVETHVNKKLSEIDSKIMKIKSQFKSNKMDNPLVIFKPHNCEVDTCPYLYLYDVLFSNDENKDSLSSLESEKEMLQDILNVHKNINYIFMILKSVMTVIAKGEVNILTVNNVLDTICAGHLLDITNLISEVEEYDSYINAIEECKKIENDIKVINANRGNIYGLTGELKEKDLKISELTRTIKTIDEKLESLSNERNKLNEFLESYNLYKVRKDEIDKLTDQLAHKVVELEDLDELIKQVNDLIKDSNTIKSLLDNINWDISKLSKDLLDKKINVKEFENLTEEQNKLNEQFDNLSIIKESLSSNKGIPLLFIQLYLKSTKMYVNELLEKIFENFEIDDFDINENEFNIPYIKNGLRINDVAYASQGEKSFLSLAISFALILQSIKEYNILLLDEIDATLDSKNRAMFLTILENWIDLIGSEQVFLITHNNMFDNYPVDIISTSKYRVEGYNNSNIIFSL